MVLSVDTDKTCMVNEINTTKEIIDAADDCYNAILTGYALTYNDANIADTLSYDRSKVQAFFYGNRHRFLLSAERLMPDTAYFEDILAKNATKPHTNLLSYFHGRIGQMSERGLLTKEIIEEFFNSINMLRSLLPERIQNTIQHLYVPAENLDTMTANEVWRAANETNIKQFVQLLWELIIVTYLTEHPDYEPEFSYKMKDDVTSWLDSYHGVAWDKLHTANKILTKIQQEQRLREVYTTGDRGRSLVYQIISSHRQFLSEDVWMGWFKEVEKEEWWQSFCEFINFISPIRKNETFLLFKMLLGLYEKDTDTDEFISDANHLFKLIRFFFKENTNAYFQYRRHKGKHVIGLNSKNIWYLIHEVVHTVNGHKPAGAVYEKTHPRYGAIVRFLQEFISDAGALVMPVGPNEARRIALSDALNYSGEPIKSFCSSTSNRDKLAALVKDVSLDPAKLILLSERLRDWFTSTTLNLSDEKILTILREMIISVNESTSPALYREFNSEEEYLVNWNNLLTNLAPLLLKEMGKDSIEIPLNGSDVMIIQNSNQTPLDFRVTV